MNIKAAFLALFLCASAFAPRAWSQDAKPTVSTVAKREARNNAQNAAQTPGEQRITRQLEGMLGHPLSADQRAQVHEAVQQRNAAILAAMQQCLVRIAQITGLSPAQILARERQQRASGNSGTTASGG